MFSSKPARVGRFGALIAARSGLSEPSGWAVVNHKLAHHHGGQDNGKSPTFNGQAFAVEACTHKIEAEGLRLGNVRFYRPKRTFCRGRGMSAKGQKRTPGLSQILLAEKGAFRRCALTSIHNRKIRNSRQDNKG